MTHCNSVHLTNVRPVHTDVYRWYISASGGKVLSLGTTAVPLEQVEKLVTFEALKVGLPFS